MKETVPKRVRFVRMAVFVLAVAFAVCVIVQVFLAGLSIFVDPIHWAQHTNFVHFFEFLAILMLPLSFVGRLPKAIRWQIGGLITLIFLMYFTANITPVLPLAAAAHPVVALVLVWLSVHIVTRTWKVAR